MTREEFLESVDIKTKEVEAFGMTVKVKPLTIGEAKELQDELEGKDEFESMCIVVSKVMTEPKLDAKDLINMDAVYMEDLTKIVNTVYGE